MPEIPGFLPFSRATFVMDFVVVAMAIVIPIMLGSIFLVRYKQLYHLHKKIQIGLGSTLAVALLLFELDVRINGWEHLAEPSPYFDSLVFPSLIVHLCFAIPTFFLWVVTIIGAIKLYDPIRPTKTKFHKVMGRFSTIFLLGTTLTGWIFFWLAFVA